MTLATVVGVPAGTFLANVASWRTAFVGVGALAAVAFLGVATILPRLKGVEAVGLAERIAIARRPDVLKLLAVTMVALLGPFAANTYLGVLIESALGVGGVTLSGVLMFFGVVSFGGYGADRWPRERFIAVIFVVLIVAFAALSLGPGWDGFWGGVTVFAGLTLWGLFDWAFPIAQQARIVTLDPALASITLSLNTSALYIGAAIGSSLGALAVSRWSVDSVGWLAAVTELGALGLLIATSAPKPRTAEEAAPVAAACLLAEE
jgi:predicted MFS family arabinose efflux permease